LINAVPKTNTANLLPLVLQLHILQTAFLTIGRQIGKFYPLPQMSPLNTSTRQSSRLSAKRAPAHTQTAQTTIIVDKWHPFFLTGIPYVKCYSVSVYCLAAVVIHVPYAEKMFTLFALFYVHFQYSEKCFHLTD